MGRHIPAGVYDFTDTVISSEVPEEGTRLTNAGKMLVDAACREDPPASLLTPEPDPVIVMQRVGKNPRTVTWDPAGKTKGAHTDWCDAYNDLNGIYSPDEDDLFADDLRKWKKEGSLDAD